MIISLGKTEVIVIKKQEVKAYVHIDSIPSKHTTKLHIQVASYHRLLSVKRSQTEQDNICC
jgi:hypothetical protein